MEETYERIDSEPNVKEMEQSAAQTIEPSTEDRDEQRSLTSRGGEHQSAAGASSGGEGDHVSRSDTTRETRSSSSTSVSRSRSGSKYSKRSTASEGMSQETSSMSKKLLSDQYGDTKSLLSFKGELKREKLRVIPKSVLIVFVLSIICLVALLVLTTFNYIRICKLENAMRQNFDKHNSAGLQGNMAAHSGVTNDDRDDANTTPSNNDQTTPGVVPQVGNPAPLGSAHGPQTTDPQPQNLSVVVYEDGSYVQWHTVKEYIDTEIMNIKNMLSQTRVEIEENIYVEINRTLEELENHEQVHHYSQVTTEVFTEMLATTTPTTTTPTTPTTTTPTTTTPTTTTPTTTTPTTTTPTTTTSTTTVPTTTTEIVLPSAYKKNPHTDTWFRKILLRRSWEEARLYCEEEGEYLATFDSLESSIWMMEMQKEHGWRGATWVGGHRYDDKWIWEGRLTGEITYDYWKDDAPNSEPGDCMLLSLNELNQWNNYNCGSALFFICETTGPKLQVE